MAKRLTVEECLKRVKHNRRILKSGKKLKPKERSKALHLASYFNRKAEALKKQQARPLVKIIKRRAPKLVKGQGFLPNFLSQMSVVRIEEMIANQLFREIKAQLEGLSLQDSALKSLNRDIAARMPAVEISFPSERKGKKAKAS